MPLKQNQIDAVKRGLAKLELLADEAENAGMFEALNTAKALAREQIKFNQVIGQILCS
jgi:hypothetical protein